MKKKETLKGEKNRNIYFHGSDYSSIAELCESLGISYCAYTSFCYRKKKEIAGLSLEEKFELFEKTRKKKFVSPEGRTYQNVSDYCKEIGIDPHRIYSRLYHGHQKPEELFAPENLLDRKYEITDHKGNVYPSEKAMCEAYNVTYQSYKYWRRKGKSIEESLARERKSLECTDHKGNVYPTVADMCKAYGLTRSNYNRRLSIGMTQKEALETPKKHHNKVKDHKGNVYKTQKDLLSEYGISKTVYENRLSHGWSLEKTLTTPIRKIMKRTIVPGYVFSTSCGLKAEIISINGQRVTIRSEDGEEYTTHYSCIQKETTGHPYLSRKKNVCKYKGFLAKFSAEVDGNVFYECECQICGEKSVMTPQDMLKHAKKHDISTHASQ